ncbi:MAG: hypothetical protein I8H76_04530 [Burkholderiales bacterium]|nr:hypothetical protein [Burkholderiales bacterium]MBH2015239.1 hypothetical protein [Burkholderiales bacterium]
MTTPVHPRHSQSGVISLLAAFTLLLAVMLSVLSVDTARLWMAKRQVQRTADMAALAAARYTGCGSSSAQAVLAATNSASVNGLKLSGTGSNGTLTLQRGVHGVDAAGLRTFTVQDSEASNAARVQVSQTVPSSIAASLMGEGNTTLRATATAKGGPPVGTYSIGSFASITQRQANFITSLFRGILGNNSLNLGVAALTDLAGTSINLLALQAVAGAATLDELLNREVPLSQLLQWLATASPSSAAAQTALNQLGSASLNSGLKVRLRDVLSIQIPASQASATVDINLLDLVQTSLLVGKGKGLLNLDLNVGNGVGAISLNLLNPPKIAVGPAGKSLAGAWCSEAKSAQLSLKVGLNINLLVAALDMALYVDVLQTAGRLSDLSIKPGNTTGNFNVASDVVVLRLNDAKTVDGSKRAVVTALGLPVLGIDLRLPLLSAQNATAPFQVTSSADLPKRVQTQGVGSGTIAGLLGDDTVIKFVVLGFLPFNLSWLQDALAFPLQLIANIVVEPLLQLFGFDIGLVRVQLLDIESSKPVLIQ